MTSKKRLDGSIRCSRCGLPGHYKPTCKSSPLVQPIRKNVGQLLSKQECVELLKKHGDNMSSIAREKGFCSNTITRYMRCYNLISLLPRQKGVKKGQTWQRKDSRNLKILDVFKELGSKAAVSRVFGISRQRVSQIVAREITGKPRLRGRKEPE